MYFSDRIAQVGAGLGVTIGGVATRAKELVDRVQRRVAVLEEEYGIKPPPPPVQLPPQSPAPVAVPAPPSSDGLWLIAAAALLFLLVK